MCAAITGSTRQRSVRVVEVRRERRDVYAFVDQFFGFLDRRLAVDVAVLGLAVVDLAGLFREVLPDIVGVLREVVAQIIDYAKDLSGLSYDELDKAVSKAEAPDGNGSRPAKSLYGTVTDSFDDEALPEERFSRALWRTYGHLAALGQVHSPPDAIGGFTRETANP